jgi:hypothetical protein
MFTPKWNRLVSPGGILYYVTTECPKKENLPKEIGRALIKNH